MACLLEVFAALHDPRSAHGRRYGLPAVLSLIVVALLAGARNFSQIYAFGQARPGLLARLGFGHPKQVRRPQRRGRPLACPNEDTLANILELLPPAQLNDKFTLWLGRLVGRGASVAAIDGKALRGADEYVLSVFVNDLRQVVWQEDVGDKENELSTLERSLPEILARYPGLRLFTGDAAFCHKSIARELIKAKRDYFLQLKAPHKTDLKLAQDSFRQLRTLPPPARSEEKRGVPRGRSGSPTSCGRTRR